MRLVPLCGSLFGSLTTLCCCDNTACPVLCRDQWHEGNSCLYEFVHMQHIILTMKGVSTARRFTAVPRPDVETATGGSAKDREAALPRFKFCDDGKHTTLFPHKYYNNEVPIVNLDKKLLPLFPDEEVLEATPQVCRLTCCRYQWGGWSFRALVCVLV